jgi:tripartite-type tricarboxylate transporter receptor subunit TctC
LIGTDAAAKAAPDGYTIFVFGINQTIAPALYRNLPHDLVRDFAHISLYGTLPSILVVHPSVPAKNVKELVALAKGAPGSMRYGSSGVGASPHLTMELFKSRSGVPDFEVTVWQGLAVLATTLKWILDRLHAFMMTTLAAPDLKQKFTGQGMTAAPVTREAFVAFIRSEVVKWAKVVSDSGAKID